MLPDALYMTQRVKGPKERGVRSQMPCSSISALKPHDLGPGTRRVIPHAQERPPALTLRHIAGAVCRGCFAIHPR